MARRVRAVSFFLFQGHSGRHSGSLDVDLTGPHDPRTVSENPSPRFTRIRSSTGGIEPRWVVLAAGFLILFMGGGRLAIFGLVFKPLSEDLDLSRSTLSLVVTTSSIVAAPALLLTGRLLDKHSLRLIMAAATLVSGVSIASLGLVNAPWQVFLLYGVAFPFANPGTSLLPVQVMISRWFQRGHGLANAVAQSGGSLGQLVLIGLLAAFMDDLGWRAAFSVLGIAFLLAVMPLVFTLVPASRSPRDAPSAVRRQDPKSESPESAKDTANEPNGLKDYARSRALWILAFVYVICGFHDVFVSTHLVAFATDQDVSQRAAGSMLAVMGVMAFAGVLTAGLMANTVGAVAATMLCFLLRIAIFSMIVLVKADLAIFGFGLLFAFTFLITAPLVTVFVQDLFGQRNLAILASFVLMVHQLGGGLGAFAGGLIFDASGSYDAAFSLMLGLSVIAAFTTLFLRKRTVLPSPAAAARA